MQKRRHKLHFWIYQVATYLIMLPFVFDIYGQNADIAFNDHKVAIHTGRLKYPKWMVRVSNQEWRDENGKLVDPPEINFAGKYYIGVHSCGTGCRYYSITDLTTGKDLSALDMFTTGEKRPKTSEGFEYMSILYYRPDSKMLVAQYLVDTGNGEQCRERKFVLEKSVLRPISPTIRRCSETR